MCRRALAVVLITLCLACAALGARISPLHNHFPIDIRKAALEEAQSLTVEKVRL